MEIKMTSIATFSNDPIYTIKAVSKRTGIKTVTLRAWERRYNLLEPQRLDNGYRLYSERDVQVLMWVQEKQSAGESISLIANQFVALRQEDKWPDAVEKHEVVIQREPAPRPARDYAEMLFGALISHQEAKASLIMDDVQRYFDVIEIFEEVIYPALVLIGEAWYRGEIRIATEHFASGFVRGRLMRILQSIPMRKDGGLVLVGCAPEEDHEIAALMFAVLLRSSGYFVEYLGPDLPINDLVDYAAAVRPKLIVLSASSEDSGDLLIGLSDKLSKLRSKPKLVYGGRYFNMNESAREALGGIYLGASLQEGLKRIKELMPVP